MIKNILAVAAIAVFVASASFASDDKGKKVIAVNKCPMMGSDSTKAEGGSSDVTIKNVKYKVNFCCGGCKGEFAKLSKADQAKKIAEATKPAAKKKA